MSVTQIALVPSLHLLPLILITSGLPVEEYRSSEQWAPSWGKQPGNDREHRNQLKRSGHLVFWAPKPTGHWERFVHEVLKIKACVTNP